MNRSPIVHPKITQSAKALLTRDPGLKLYRTDVSATDAEGNYTGSETLIATFNGSLGQPGFEDQQVAAQTGTVVDAVLVTAPQTTFQFIVGDFIEARGFKWKVLNVFTQIITTLHLQRFGVV